MDILYKWISISDRFSKIYLNKYFSELGINASQHMFVKKICNTPGISQDRLVDLVYINKSNVTRALSQLEEKGFIEKKTNEQDKRTALLYPTEKAKKIYAEIRRIENDWVEIMTGELSEEEKQLLLQLIKRVALTSIDFIQHNKQTEK